MGEVREAMKNPDTIDAFFGQELLGKLEAYGVTIEDLQPLGAVLMEKGVDP